MINRTLIRLKVVQMLYAHLISRTEFNIPLAPLRDTKDAINSFGIYTDAITALMLITGQRCAMDKYPSLQGECLVDTIERDSALMHELGRDANTKQLIGLCAINPKEMLELVKECKKEIRISTILADYKKKRNKTPDDEIRLWTTLTETVVIPLLKELYQAVGKDASEYAFGKGSEETVATIRNYGQQRISFIEARNELIAALQKAYKLYIALIALAVELVREKEQLIDNAKNKYLPTAHDLNPNTRFINNSLIAKLSAKPEIADFIEKNPFYWDEAPQFLRQMLDLITSSHIYREYVESDNLSYKTDCEFWIKTFEEIVIPSDLLAEAMESKDIYWNDDLNIVGQFVVKTFKASLWNDDNPEIMPMFRDEDDREFATKLFRYAAENYHLYRQYIDKMVTEKWDPDRLAFMDVVIMVTAIAELINFPIIPMPVTMNEYTDIAGDYSSPKSSQFVNGMLFAIAQQLKKEGKIMK